MTRSEPTNPARNLAFGITTEGAFFALFVRELASEVLGRPVAGSISIDRDLTAIALLRLMTAASTFWVALQLCRDAARARLLIWCVVGISAAYAVVGLFALGFMRGGRVFEEV